MLSVQNQKQATIKYTLKCYVHIRKCQLYLEFFSVGCWQADSSACCTYLVSLEPEAVCTMYMYMHAQEVQSRMD